MLVLFVTCYIPLLPHFSHEGQYQAHSPLVASLDFWILRSDYIAFSWGRVPFFSRPSEQLACLGQIILCGSCSAYTKQEEDGSVRNELRPTMFATFSTSKSSPLALQELQPKRSCDICRMLKIRVRVAARVVTSLRFTLQVRDLAESRNPLQSLPTDRHEVYLG